MPLAQVQWVLTLVELSNDLLAVVRDKSRPMEERQAADEARKVISDAAFAAALAEFRKGTRQIVDLSMQLGAIVASVNKPGDRLRSVADRIGRLHAKVHDPEGMRTTWTSNAEFEEVFRDEADLPPAEATAPIPQPPRGVTRITDPRPINATDFASLSAEYVAFFASAEWKNDDSRREAKRFAEMALKHRGRYEAVGGPLGIPWWFVAALHLLESTFNFRTHLHNGDSLNARTFRVPAGRPASGSPPFTWEESARDALVGEELDRQQDWTLARALYRWETYNGFGYRRRRVPTPYLWSFTTIYRKGKFVGDGVFDANAVSKQCGAAAFLKALIELEQASISVEDSAEPDDTDVGQDVAPVVGPVPVVQAQPAVLMDFKAFFERALPDVQHFNWQEFLVKGAKHAVNGLNTDPPREKWDNVVPLARVLEEFRKRIGAKVRLTNVYRSPDYNRSVGGAKNSQHVQFCAADVQVPDRGGPQLWADTLRAMRQEGFFSGGIGIYNSFVHVDTRGSNADWDER
jgi:lysozyme family protein